MTFSDLFARIKTTWHSRPLALIIPIVALGVFWATHGHTLTRASFPTFGEWVAGSLLWTASFEKVADFLLPKTPPAGPVALVLALALGAASCGTLAPTPTPIEPVAGTPSCNAFNLIDDVGSDLVSGQWLNALEDLARLCGQDVVSLVVREVGTKSAHAAMASGDGVAKLKADHARTYLLIHPVAVAQ